MLDTIIRFCLQNKLVVALLIAFLVTWGIIVAPFDWNAPGLIRDPVPVDAIPDIGENQQIVFTEWMGRSPQDVEDQITYPLTASLLGLPGVQSIRSFSNFGFSTIFVIFDESVEFYWSRTRILEKLNSLPPGLLPEGVNPVLGPDSTAVGQVFWYTLEGVDADGNPTGGWDLHELRSIQDWYVRYSLQSVQGVSEVSSVGGFVREYQIDVDPNAMRAYGVSLDEVFNAVRQSNIDVGARTIEINRVEYVIRGLGFIQSVDDLRRTVIKSVEGVPITLDQVAHIGMGPAERRGALDKEGAEAVGGVVVVRYGENPLEVIQNVKKMIDEISPGLPRKTLEDGTVSQVRIVPFYDRTGLIQETLGTLKTALIQQIMVTIIVVVLMVNHLRSSLLISSLLPLSVLGCFIAMKIGKVDANIVALSGIAIAIGTMVDMGIVICENILKRLEEAKEGENRLEVVFRATSEVGSAVLTAVATTIISFLPVFTMEAAEGKLFRPLAYTKTFALFAAILISLTIIPPLAHWLFTQRVENRKLRDWAHGGLMAGGLIVGAWFSWIVGAALLFLGVFFAVTARLPEVWKQRSPMILNGVAAFIVAVILTIDWMPIGVDKGVPRNFIFVASMIGGLLITFHLFLRSYEPILRWCLDNKAKFILLPSFVTAMGFFTWIGFDSVFGFLPEPVKQSRMYQAFHDSFPGMGREFMPSLDEGSFLLMPTTMPHASIGEALEVLQFQDQAIAAIPEIDTVVGKIGRADSPMDPAPVSMVETVINYKPEYIVDERGRRTRFKYDSRIGKFARDASGELIPHAWGRPYRQWREHIRSPNDIWDEISKVTQITGTTSAPMLQPIMTRIIMLQSGMRAPIGVKVFGPDLQSIEQVALDIEQLLKEVPSVRAETVVADRVVGKPYFEIDIDRDAIARYGLTIQAVQDVIEIAIGGRTITTTVEGRERYPVRVRYLRELRDTHEGLGAILVPTPGEAQIPLRELAEIRYVRGPQMIRSEDTFLVAYVMFDRRPGHAEVEVVEESQRYLREMIASGRLDIPAGVSFRFAGNYENQQRAAAKLRVVLPMALFIIFLIIYLQFRSIPVTFIVFSGILVAWAGGFMMLWYYDQPWFLNITIFGENLRDVFQVQTFNLSVAVWVGFLALFGIATDDGVIMATYLKQSFARRRPEDVAGIRNAVIEAGLRRVRPCLMTSATTILALLPILTSVGRGADVMIPMAIPSFGGMTVVLLSMFVAPTLYCWLEEWRLTNGGEAKRGA